MLAPQQPAVSKPLPGKVPYTHRLPACIMDRMDAEHMRDLLLTLPHARETEQWGGLVFWVGDKLLGGKMFAWMELADPTSHVLCFPTEPERRAELLEHDAFFPAPYFGRIGWLAARRWNALPNPEWRDAMIAAHTQVEAKLTRRTRAWLALPRREQQALLRQKRATPKP